MEREIKIGDKVSKKTGVPFENGKTVVTVKDIHGRLAWFNETNTHMYIGDIYVVEDAEKGKVYKGWEILKLISENQLKDGAVVKRVSTLGNEQEYIVKRDFISRINDDSLFGQELGNSYFTDESEWYIND